MKVSKKTALHLSLFIIVVYWLYELFVVNHNGILPNNFSDFIIRVSLIKVIHLVVIILLLKLEGDGFHEMGFSTNNWKKQLLFGLLMGLILFLLVNVGLTSVLNSLFPKSGSSGNILKYFSESRNLVLWLAIGIFGGGVVEEVNRIFVLTRFQKRFGKAGLYFALMCSSLVFGIGHLYQGTGAAISTGVSGLILGSIYIRRNSAIELITIHAFSDVLAILGAYLLAGYR